MTRVGPRGAIALAAAWLATLLLAFQIGSGGRPDASRRSGPGSPQKTLAVADELRTARNYDFNETRRLGTQNRFVTFTQTLGGDELARILPEISDKMSLAQVQSTLQRLFDEVDPGPARRIARFELVRRWAQLNPEEALEHIADLSDPKMRHDLRLKGIEGWASIDPGAALAFAIDSKDELVAKSKEAAKTGYGAMRDLDSAIAFVASLASDDTPDPGWTVAAAVESLFHNDDLAVIRWVESLSLGPLRDQAMTGMLGQWARHDPESAAEWIEEHADPSNLARHRELIRGLAAQSQ